MPILTSRRERKKVEMLFAHLKRILKLDRLRLRGPNGAKDEFLLAATAQNLRKLAKLIPDPADGARLRGSRARPTQCRDSAGSVEEPTSSTQSAHRRRSRCLMLRSYSAPLFTEVLGLLETSQTTTAPCWWPPTAPSKRYRLRRLVNTFGTDIGCSPQPRIRSRAAAQGALRLGSRIRAVLDPFRRLH